MHTTPLTRLTRTAARLAAGLLVAGGLAAGLGARDAAADTTTTHAVAIQCTSFGPTGQVCSPSFIVPVQTTGVVRLRFTGRPTIARTSASAPATTSCRGRSPTS